MATNNSANFNTGASGTVLTGNGVGVAPTFQAASSGVTGPGSSTDRAIATWNGTGGTALFNNSTTKIDSTGRQTNSAQPIFAAYPSSNISNVTGDGTAYNVIYNTTTVNQGTSYDTSNGFFTCPIAGNYLFTVTVGLFGLGVAHTGGIFDIFSGSDGRNIFRGNPGIMRDTGNFLVLSGSIIINLAASAIVAVQVTVSGSTKTVGILSPFNNTTWCGYLLC